MSNDQAFTPALGRREWTGLYDVAIALMTREGRWRNALLEQCAPKRGELVLDVGCGTGSLAALILARTPGVRMIGLDPDTEVLDRARRKLRGRDIEFIQGFAGDADRIGAGRADKVVSSLVFHQTPMAEKRAGLGAVFRALKPGGELHIADYGCSGRRSCGSCSGKCRTSTGLRTPSPTRAGCCPN